MKPGVSYPHGHVPDRSCEHCERNVSRCDCSPSRCAFRAAVSVAKWAVLFLFAALALVSLACGIGWALGQGSSLLFDFIGGLV